MSGFFESKSLKRTEFESPRRKRDEKRCFRHNGTMYWQVCDRVRRDSISLPLANKSMIYSKISSGSVFMIMASSGILGELGITAGDGVMQESRVVTSYCKKNRKIEK